MGKTTKHYSREFTIFRESSLVYGMMCYMLWEISMNFKENYRNRIVAAYKLYSGQRNFFQHNVEKLKLNLRFSFTSMQKKYVLH